MKAGSRKKAIQKAKDHAKVPRQSKGGERIDINELSESSRGKKWGEMRYRNAESLGARNPKGKNYWMEHPGGHPDAGLPGVPKHHEGGHVHSVNNAGEEIFLYGSNGGCYQVCFPKRL